MPPIHVLESGLLQNSNTKKKGPKLLGVVSVCTALIHRKKKSSLLFFTCSILNRIFQKTLYCSSVIDRYLSPGCRHDAPASFVDMTSFAVLVRVSREASGHVFLLYPSLTILQTLLPLDSVLWRQDVFFLPDQLERSGSI